jgi:hypothetical protein
LRRRQGNASARVDLLISRMAWQNRCRTASLRRHERVLVYGKMY